MNQFFQKKQSSRGYTLLFAVLVSSLVLAVGISILNISKKEFLIATSTRDSSSALYAAESGLECAFFGDMAIRDAFDTGTDQTSQLGCSVPYKFVLVSLNTPGSGEGKFIFHAKFGTTGSSCSVVTLTKEFEDVGGVERLRTTIDSRGYNTGWLPGATPLIGTCDVASAKRVERGLRYSGF